jgi:MOSC domain-containing protein YiiM
VVAICTSRERGVVKLPVSEAQIRTDHGIVGDAHAGPWSRQVSLLAKESIDRMRQVLPDLDDGAFAENIVTQHVDLVNLQVGDRMRLGSEIYLEVTQIGKECHTACAIGQATGDCIMPREGIFCRVVTGGWLRPGDPVQITEKTAQDQ